MLESASGRIEAQIAIPHGQTMSCARNFTRKLAIQIECSPEIIVRLAASCSNYEHIVRLRLFASRFSLKQDVFRDKKAQSVDVKKVRKELLPFLGFKAIE